ncbi:MAG: hypothetical protein LBD29_00295 [Treponema sp.]|jgi:hypothetical protein|nr:hypothetical protein [Treponema sp.]
MREIQILELFIAVLILVPLSRPFVKDLQNLEGIVLFPPLALVSGIALFPVYGFRPESLPLLAVVIVVNIHNLSGLISLLKRDWNDPSPYLGLGRTGIMLGFLGISLVIALYFAPAINTDLTTQGVTAVRVRHEARKAEFFLRIYGPSEETYPSIPRKRPLLFVVPPAIGSITAVDKICGALEAQGFTVIAYSRRNFDFPSVGEAGKKYSSPLGTVIRLFRVLLMGTQFEESNILGRTFEGERTEDILFLLSYIKNEDNLVFLQASTDKNTIFLAGYGFSGSAAVYIGESAELLKQNPEIKGLIAVESPFWSVYKVEERQPPMPPEAAVEWFKNLWTGVAKGVLNLKPKKMIGIERILRPLVPTLFLVSDRAAAIKRQEQRYQPIVRTIHSSSSAAAMAAVNGAGILDYSDYPAKYPLYRVFFSGSKQGLWKNSEFIEGTAALITAFAGLVLSGEPQNRVKVPALLGSQERFLENIHFEAGRVWNLPSLEGILSP